MLFQMHGATYTVDAEFKTSELVDKSNWVVDIGAASTMLAEVLSKYNFKNLNELFPGQNTTTEFMCKVGRPFFLFFVPGVKVDDARSRWNRTHS